MREREREKRQGFIFLSVISVKVEILLLSERKYNIIEYILRLVDYHVLMVDRATFLYVNFFVISRIILKAEVCPQMEFVFFSERKI